MLNLPQQNFHPSHQRRDSSVVGIKRHRVLVVIVEMKTPRFQVETWPTKTWKHGKQISSQQKKNKKNITLPNVFKDIKQKTVRESTTRSDIIENFSYLNTWFRQCLYNPYITTYSISIPKKNIPRFFVLTPRIMKLAAGRDHTPPPSSCSEPVLVIGDKT